MRLIHGAWQTITKLGMAIFAAVSPSKKLDTMKRNGPDETALADTEDRQPSASIEEATHAEVMSEGDDDFFVITLLGLAVVVEEVGSE